MVVASSCLAFRAPITQARILPIPSSAETWKIVTKRVSQFFFASAGIHLDGYGNPRLRLGFA